MGYLEKKLQAIVSTLNTWKLMTGNLYVMTSNSEPSPFVAFQENKYGSSTISTTNYFQAFNNNAGNNVYITATGNGGYVGVQLNFGKTVRVKKLLFDGSQSGNDFRVIDLYRIEGGSTTRVKSITNPTTQTYTITDGALDYFECDAIRFLVRSTYTDANAYMTVKRLQVTEWYEKG